MIEIDPDKIRDVIGPGGKTIHKIINETGVKIDIEQDGRVFISSQDEETGLRAKEIIEKLTADVEVGATYTGKVTRTAPFGVFVEVLPGKEGLVRSTELYPVDVDDLEVGDELQVRVSEIDHLGRINLSTRMSPQDRRGARDRDPRNRNKPNKFRKNPGNTRRGR